MISASILVAACSIELAPLDDVSSADGGAGTSFGGVAGEGIGGAKAGQAGSIGSGGIAGSAAAGAGGSPDGSLGGSGGIGPGKELGDFVLEYYFLVEESNYSGAKDTTLFDPSCNAIAVVSSKFSLDLAAIGTGLLVTGEIISYEGSCSCPLSPCYVIADSAHPWGYGAQQAPLVPFRSIAADKGLLPFGTKVYVPAFEGTVMPGAAPWGGFTHDGCVQVDDTATSVGKAINWFVAFKAYETQLKSNLGLTSVIVYEAGSKCP